MLTPLSSFENVDFIKGALLLVDKPKGWTSFDVVNKIRHAIRRKLNLKKIKVGHSGTLDPMATGLLLVCTGAWTKELHHLLGLDKKYRAEIILGLETDTYDAEGVIVSQKDLPSITNELLENIIQKFKGEFEQVPPSFSAIKKEGKPLYESARAGKEVKPDPRKVVVYKIDILDFSENKLILDIHCGSGFYVRSLAHDIGALLGCGAHLSALSRTMIGPYSLKDAFSVEEIVKAIES